MSESEMQPTVEMKTEVNDESAEQQVVYHIKEGEQNAGKQWYSEALLLDKQHHPLEESEKEEIRAALLAGQKTITLSADDESLEAKIAEIVRQSRLVEQGEGSQQFIEIVNDEQGNLASRILSGGTVSNDGETEEDKVVEIDLMNFKLVRYEGDAAQEVSGEDDTENNMNVVITEHDIASEHQYVQISNNEDTENDNEVNDQVSHLCTVVSNNKEHKQHRNSSGQQRVQYVQVVERDSVPLVFFTAQEPKPPQPVNISTPSAPSKGRKRGEFFIPQEVIDSPNFKYYLYNCKLCDFKCNAIKELTAHKATHPGVGTGRYRYLAKPPTDKIDLLTPPPQDGQFVEHCDMCPYKATSRLQMNRHITKYHTSSKSKTGIEGSTFPTKPYQTYEVITSEDSVTYYSCRNCDYKTDSRSMLRRHKCKNKSATDQFVLS